MLLTIVLLTTNGELPIGSVIIYGAITVLPLMTLLEITGEELLQNDNAPEGHLTIRPIPRYKITGDELGNWSSRILRLPAPRELLYYSG